MDPLVLPVLGPMLAGAGKNRFEVYANDAMA